MNLEDFETWLRVKSHKYERPIAWRDCIDRLIAEFKSECLSGAAEEGI